MLFSGLLVSKNTNMASFQTHSILSLGDVIFYVVYFVNPSTITKMAPMCMAGRQAGALCRLCLHDVISLAYLFNSTRCSTLELRPGSATTH